MGKIIAIGGGDFNETDKINKEIIRLCGKDKPKALYAPTAGSDTEFYCREFITYFGEILGCETEILYLGKEKTEKEEIQERIFTSDIIYVGGGITGEMISVWKTYGVDSILKEAYEKGIVITGVSAGAMCWFTWCGAGVRDQTKKLINLLKVPGLGWIDGLCCPHYNDPRRKRMLKALIKHEPILAIGISDYCAIEIIDERYKIILSRPWAKAYKVYWKDNTFYEKPIKKETVFQPLKELLTIET
jgi:dipeptidase E